MSQRPPPWNSTPTPVVVVLRFEMPVAHGDSFRERARSALDVLAAQPGLVSGGVARGVDDPARWVLTLAWESVGHYRRALSASDVKMAAVPLLSEAVDEATVFELLDGRAGWQGRAESALAPDAGQVRPGEENW